MNDAFSAYFTRSYFFFRPFDDVCDLQPSYDPLREKINTISFFFQVYKYLYY